MIKAILKRVLQALTPTKRMWPYEQEYHNSLAQFLADCERHQMEQAQAHKEVNDEVSKLVSTLIGYGYTRPQADEYVRGLLNARPHTLH